MTRRLSMAIVVAVMLAMAVAAQADRVTERTEPGGWQGVIVQTMLFGQPAHMHLDTSITDDNHPQYPIRAGDRCTVLYRRITRTSGMKPLVYLRVKMRAGGRMREGWLMEGEVKRVR